VNFPIPLREPERQERPLTPALSPSAGEGEKHSQRLEQAMVQGFKAQIFNWENSLNRFAFLCVLCVAAFCFGTARASVADSEKSFQAGVEAWRSNDFTNAANNFRQSVAAQPASGAYLNLGIAEWQLGHPAAAVLAWERALWLNPFDANAKNNLRFARDLAQLESPELRWHETGSMWMPKNFWAGLTAVSLWLVVGMLTLPTVFRWRKAAWHQAVAALGLGILLLCLPANLGVWTRSHIGFILEKNVPLRLTPTADAEPVTRLAAGEPARLVRARGKYVYIRTSRNAGWVEQAQLGLISR
jgi:tetratricopeptide (TPR) repeat protein